MKYLCVHETLVKRTTQSQIYGVNEYHKEIWKSQAKNGLWITYNEFVDVDGKRTKVRSFGEETCAVVGHNCAPGGPCDTYSVCFALAGDFQTFNEAQIKTWREIVAELGESSEITLHRNLQAGRTCPGKLITVEYLKNLLPTHDTTPLEDVRKIDAAQYMSVFDGMKALLTAMLLKINRK